MSRSKPPATTPAPFDVACPSVDSDHQATTDFKAVTPGAPELEAYLTISDLGHRDFCVVPGADDSQAVAEKIVSYDVVLDQRDNYGERYGTFVRDGSEELLNFPFDFHVYGKCRDVTATIVVHVGGTSYTYRAPAHAGPRCPG